MEPHIHFEKITEALKTLPSKISNVALNFSKERFDKQDWVDSYAEAWPERKSESWGRKSRAGRALLVDSGRLRSSLKVLQMSSENIVIGVRNVPYAKAHNEGFEGDVKQHINSFVRKKTRFGIVKMNKRRAVYGRQVVGETTVKAFDRTIHQKLKRRKFMGESAELNKQFLTLISTVFNVH